MRYGYVYIMTNKPNGTIYTGVTTNIAQRAGQHRVGTGSSFCKAHGLTRLIYVERHDLIVDAIAREKNIKAWQRAWKLKLIHGVNPDWNDLYDNIHDWM